MEDPIAIRIEGISKRFGELQALKNVSFLVKKGECFGILGPNGAGKTTLLNILIGWTTPDKGFFEVNGKRPGDFRVIKREIGFIAQDEILDEDLTTFQNLYFHGLYYDLSKREAKKRAEELLNFFGLTRKEEQVKNLSGGMKKKLAIAKALIHNPDVLIMDEPTIGLDPRSRSIIWDTISVLSNSGKTVLLTTHYMDEAEKLCERVSILNNGEIIDMGEPHRLISTHLPPAVLEVKVDSEDERKELLRYINEHSIEYRLSGNIFILYPNNPDTARGEILLLGIENLLKRRPNLEDLFLKLTGRGLRDESF